MYYLNLGPHFEALNNPKSDLLFNNKNESIAGFYNWHLIGKFNIFKFC